MLRRPLAVGIALLAVHVACRDAGAQAASDAGGTLGIHGSNTIGARLMPSLVEAYAASIGASVMRKAGDRPGAGGAAAHEPCRDSPGTD
jgi:hypothetical protein